MAPRDFEASSRRAPATLLCWSPTLLRSNVHPPLKGNYNDINKEVRMVLTEYGPMFLNRRSALSCGFVVLPTTHSWRWWAQGKACRSDDAKTNTSRAQDCPVKQTSKKTGSSSILRSRASTVVTARHHRSGAHATDDT